MTKHEMAITLLQDAHERMSLYDPDKCMACGAVLHNGLASADPEQIADEKEHAKEWLIIEIDKFFKSIL